MGSGWPKITLLSVKSQDVGSIQILVLSFSRAHTSLLYILWQSDSICLILPKKCLLKSSVLVYSQATLPLIIFLLKLISLALWFPWIQTFPIRNITTSSSFKIQYLLNWARTNLQQFSMRATLHKCVLEYSPYSPLIGGARVSSVSGRGQARRWSLQSNEKVRTEVMNGLRKSTEWLWGPLI